MTKETPTREKSSVALFSIIVSIFMIAGKAAIGLISGSLAILADAVHSLLDLSASTITFFAVRISDRPADRDHHFGHAKVESLAALAEVTLLLLTCAWFVYEAVSRLLSTGNHVEVNLWVFAVIIATILVDINRVRVLKRAALKYKSQALAADALNFYTDIFSSIVVLVGMGAIYFFQIEWADSVAAIGVAGFIVYASIRMAKQAVDVLLDRAPTEVEYTIRRTVRSYPEILGVDRLRIRSDGRSNFVDLSLDMDRTLSFGKADDISNRLDNRLKSLLPGTEFIITLNPVSPDTEKTADAIRYVVSSQGRTAHHLIVNRHEEGYHATMHIEMPGDIALEAAHQVATDITARLHEAIPELTRVAIHTEPYREEGKIENRTEYDVAKITAGVKNIVESFNGVDDCHNIALTPLNNGLALVADMRLDGNLTLAETHQISMDVEERLRIEIPALTAITLHLEPHKKFA